MKDVDPTEHISVVSDLLTRIGIEMRRERLGGDGGSLCSLRGRPVFFDDIDADLATRLDRLLQALATLPQSESMYLPPEIRERLDVIRSEQ